MSAALSQNEYPAYADPTTTDVRFEARDGYPLAGTLHQPPGTVHATVLVNSATGVPRVFYHHFAQHLARNGLATLIWDYRGIGDSAPPSLRGFEATKQDWGRHDMPGAFDWLAARFPDVPHTVLGHSVGGQLLGLMPDSDRIDAVVTVGCGFGYWGHVAGSYRFVVAGLWYVVIPVVTGVAGFMPGRRLGLGEDLPNGVAREWARWGKRPDYFSAELAAEPGFHKLRAPWRAWLLSDDPVATRDNVAPLHALYKNARVQTEVLEPEMFGLDEIGHVGFFSRKRSVLWDRPVDWLLDAVRARPAP